jgi:putative copper export protein
MPKPIIFGTIRALHDLFTAFWIGGLLTTAIAFMPAMKRSSEKPGSLKTMLKAYHHHLRIVAVVSMVGLWITGLLLSRQSSALAGFLNFSDTYNVLLSIKHLLVFVMIGIGLFRGFILGRKIEHFTAKDQKMYAVLLVINGILGVIVLFLSGISAGMG